MTCCTDPPDLIHIGGKWWVCINCGSKYVDNGRGVTLVCKKTGNK